ncbi:MAG: transcription termination factor NusA [Candidatus Aminicenantes bacterium RBG_13_63_10]|nr:MAG: transcription termination factor NusA [Candidatus Aminicenantes bacterium RBG_13_63_10]
MKINVWNTILQLSKERGVEPGVIVNAIKESLRVASANYFVNNETVEIFFYPEKGELRVFVLKKVAENSSGLDPSVEISLEEARKINPFAKPGDSLEVDLPAATLGRISAQAAKQVILQKVRDAEQEKIFEDFAPRQGEIVNGLVRRVEASGAILEVNKTEAVLPQREQLPQDAFQRGDRVKAVISHVQMGHRGAQIYLSRTSPRFLAKLLELEIPEIANNIIVIKNIVRQPGERAKVAVFTQERDVDPMGACIGPKGSRILAISKELQGEKIDIVSWSSNPAAFAKAALSPARPSSVVIDSQEGNTLQALVPGDQLSLAIGKKGINVKLASKLVGWKIGIKEMES